MLSGGAKLGADEMRHLWNKARASVTGDLPPEDPKKTLALEMQPEEVKVLYARALALQSLVDGWLDPREIEYLYVFMSRVSMSSDSREEIRQTLATRETSPEDVVRLVEEVIWAVPDMIVRGWWLCRSFESGGKVALTKAKLTSMQMLAHLIATSGTLLKTGVIFGMNPLALKWAQLLALPPVTLAWISETAPYETS